MSNIKHSGSADSMPTSGSSCGIKPSKEAIDKGYEIDFSKAKSLIENGTESTTPSKHKPAC